MSDDDEVDLTDEINRVYDLQFEDGTFRDLVKLVAKDPALLKRVISVYLTAELSDYLEYQGTVHEDLSAKDLIAVGQIVPTLFAETILQLLTDADPEIAEGCGMEPFFGGDDCLQFVKREHLEIFQDYMAAKNERESKTKH